MKFESELIEGHLVQRYKRFFADVEYIDPKTKKKIAITIHVPNTGSLKSVIEKNASPLQKCWFSLSDDPNRKLKGTLHAVQTIKGSWVGINTSSPNKIVTEAAQESIKTGKPIFKHWKGFGFYKSEYKISKESRLDGVFVKSESDLTNPKSKKHFIEIKNTTLLTEKNNKRYAQFPDAVTERGQKHLTEMMKLIDQGHTCELIFTVQRSDVDLFSVAEDIDPEYGKLFKKAVDKGLIVTPALVELSQQEIKLGPKTLKITS